ncbi:TPA: hypothetical protein ACMX4R_002357 [Yersinia enterocolitica]|uniref:hypothetical protein n=1 Tax=Yersinia enterocolitica TaxID=630 RepID=UPI002859AA3D|nr:hypothetical protein [Yersinia enterocolitica]HDL7089811.1 hypothetical protein [Yersinia enterocolitica]HDL7917912.1 hypothetical protein [Yersinia enterocolitica]HDV5951933.1 hypothetical protein [Yersinia enterocolitica]HED5569070.1 hypothetical protein [Yersinia enterocolitica]
MKLYHGTSHSASLLIESSGYIACNIARTYGYNSTLPTTDGFVYLTNHPGYAAYMANKVAYEKNDDFFVVYEINIEKEHLVADVDELIYVCGLSEEKAMSLSLQESLELSGCCRTPNNLHVGKSVSKQVTLPCTRNRNHPDLSKSREVIILRREGQSPGALKILDSQEWSSF